MQHANPLQSAAFPGAPPDIRSAVRQASAETGVSFSYLMAKAAAESGYRADAKASTSSATGLYQFIDSTWLGMIREHGAKFGLDGYAEALRNGTADAALRREILALREEPAVAARMAAQYARGNRDHLEGSIGGPIGETDLYLAHFLGPGGAERFLRAMRADPDRPAADLLPEAANANRAVFYTNGRPRSLAEVHSHFAAKFGEDEPVVLADAGPAIAPRDGNPPFARRGVPSIAPTTGPGQIPVTMSPASFAARMFLATLSLPGDKVDRV